MRTLDSSHAPSWEILPARLDLTLKDGQPVGWRQLGSGAFGTVRCLLHAIS